MNWLKQSQRGFINLFLLIPLIIVATVVATLSVPKIIEKNRVANISQQIEQKELELDNTNNSKTQEPLVQEIAELRKQVESLKLPSKTKEQVVSLPPKTISIPTISPVISSDLKIQLSASRYSLPANGEAVSFITAEVRDKNGRIVESFNREIEFNTTAGVLTPNKTVAKNGSAFVQLQASTVPTNLTVTAQSENIKSNSINLSFYLTPTQEPTVNKLPINSSDLSILVALVCENGVGSGVIIGPNGWVLTNDHVAKGKPCDVYISDSFSSVATKRYKAGFVISNQSLDVAVLKINQDLNGNEVSGLNYIQKGQSGNLQIGDEIRLLGYPDFGLPSYYGKPTLTQGIVSGEEGVYVKTDVKSSGGSSGGPVLDNSKRLVGIWVGVFIGSNENIGHFLKIDTIENWWRSLGYGWPY